MGTIAAILAAVGGLGAVLGIITAAEVIVPIGDEFTWTFWFMIAAILLLCSIAINMGHGDND